MATNVILEYRRSADEWQCPICDAENSMALGNCPVCGGARSADATILRRWTPTPVSRPTGAKPVARRPDYTTGRTFKDRDGTPPPEEPKTGCITALMAILIVLILLLTVFLSMANGEELYPAARCTEITTEIENKPECLSDCEYTQNLGRYEYVL